MYFNKYNWLMKFSSYFNASKYNFFSHNKQLTMWNKMKFLFFQPLQRMNDDSLSLWITRLSWLRCWNEFHRMTSDNRVFVAHVICVDWANCQKICVQQNSVRVAVSTFCKCHALFCTRPKNAVEIGFRGIWFLSIFFFHMVHLDFLWIIIIWIDWYGIIIFQFNSVQF